MSLMGIIDWMRRKIMGESKKEPPTVTPIGHATDEHRAEIEVAKEEEDRKEAEVRGEALTVAVEKEKEPRADARSFGESAGENIKASPLSREHSERITWRMVANNDRRMRHRPMIRTRAYIKAERNARRMTCKRMGGTWWR